MIFLAFIFGACIGSYLNVLIIRLPLKKSTTLERSHCPQCHKLIYWYENIPVISFLILRGRCSGCKKKISIVYPVVEIFIGIISALLLPKQLNLTAFTNYLFYFSVFCSFFIIIIIDLKHHIIPNVVNIYLAALFFVHSFFYTSWGHWLVGGLVGALFPLAVTYMFYLLRGKIGLGGGDIKLYGALGIFLGPLGIFMNLFLSCFLGSIISLALMALGKMNKNTPMAFGPFIVVVAFAQMFFPDQFGLLSRFLFPY